MRNWTTLLIVTTMWGAAEVSARVDHETQNQILQQCIDQHESWSARSACYHAWKIRVEREQEMQSREFIKENPWFGGSNWRWEECAKNPHCTNSRIRRY